MIPVRLDVRTVLGLALVLVRSSLATPTELSSISTIFAFGDSWTSTGYNPASNLSDVNMHNTTSGGDVWLQYLAKNYTSATSAYFDFASVGATIDNSVVFSNPATDFGSQVGLFENYFANSSKIDSVKWTGNTTLFAIWFGNDDLYNCFTTNKSFTDLAPRLLSSYDTAINRLYIAGARKFLYLSLPDLSATPLALSSHDATTALASAVSTWNDQLKTYVSSLSSKYPETSSTLVDTRSLTAKILESPTQYGFVNSTSSCESYSSLINAPEADEPSCGAPLERYFWKTPWNPTFPVHQLLASTIASEMDKSTAGTSVAPSSSGYKSIPSVGPSTLLVVFAMFRLLSAMLA